MASRWTLTSKVASLIPWRYLSRRDSLALRSLLSGGVSLYYSSGEYTVVASDPPEAVESWARRLSRDPGVSVLSSRLSSGRGSPWLQGVGVRLGLEWLRRLRVALDRPTCIVMGEGEDGWFASVLAPQHHWLLDKCRPTGRRLRQVLGFDLHLGEWRGGPSRVRVQGDLVAWVHLDGLEGPPAWLFYALELGRRAAMAAAGLEERLSRAVSKVVVDGDPRRVISAVEEVLRRTVYGRLLAGLISPIMVGGRLVVGLEPEAGSFISEVLGSPKGLVDQAMNAMAGGDPSSLTLLLPDYAASMLGLLLGGTRGWASSMDGVRVYYAPALLAASLLEAARARPRVPAPVRVSARLGRHSVEYYGWVLDPPASTVIAAASLARGLAAVAGVVRGRGCFWLPDASSYLGWRRGARLHIALGRVRIKHPEHGTVMVDGGVAFTLTTLNTVRL